MNVTATGSRTPQREFGEHLRTIRIRRGVTQRQLADLSTVSVRAIRDLETGRAQRPRQDTVRLIAEGLGLTGQARAAFEDSARVTAGIAPDAHGYTGPPPALDALLGREHDVAALAEVLVSGEQRLVTVVGVGGVGKSRLAQDVATTMHEEGKHVRWLSHDEHPDGPSAGIETPCRWSEGPSLLVLDGYEPSLQLARRVTGMLGNCRSLRVLLTARAPLDVVGERTFPLGPLAVPPCRAEQPGGAMTIARVTKSPAMTLLIRHIRQSRPDFGPHSSDIAALVALCQRLDGIPAALEAAASWLLVFEPAELLDRVIADPFEILAPDLLGTPPGTGAPDQALLRDLSAIDGPWSIAEAVTATGATLGACHRLVHWLAVRGLVQPVPAATCDGGGGPRFRLLELVRAGCRTGHQDWTRPLVETT